MKKIIIILLIFCYLTASAQVENVPVSHPVYNYLLRAETKGFLPNFSLSELPLQRKEIVKALILVRKNEINLSKADLEILKRYEIEFEIEHRNNAVIFFSESDTNQLLFKRILTNDEKFFYHFKDSSHSVSVIPLGSVEEIFSSSQSLNDGELRNVTLGNLGIRLYGTLGNVLGYYLQATNGAVLTGDRDLALENPKLRQNIKFKELNSDFDFSESHVTYNNDWFYATIGRETRLVGAGISHRVFHSDNAPPIDAVTVGVKLDKFHYSFTHGSLLAYYQDSTKIGFNAIMPSKFLATHRFAIRPYWGEISLWENIIYTKRGFDIAYLNPLSFMKSLEHALRDRDNSMMGLDATVRPFDGFQIKGSFLLDDIIFSEIGKNFWSNKYAWNIAMITSLKIPFDIGLEYARVEPYTYTHFDSLNAMTNDNYLFGGSLQPNSDETSILIRYWWGNRYPISFKLSYMRHGENIYDGNGNLVRNVGGDVLQTRRVEDSMRVTFLDGNRINSLSAKLYAGWEIIRGFNLQAVLELRQINEQNHFNFFIGFRYEDF